MLELLKFMFSVLFFVTYKKTIYIELLQITHNTRLGVLPLFKRQSMQLQRDTHVENPKPN